MVDVFWWRAENDRPNLTEQLCQFLQGRVPPPTLVAFNPDLHTLAEEEVKEVLYKHTLGGRPVRL